MTAPTTDTELSVQVAEPAKAEPVVKAARCEKGQELIHQWRLAYDAARKVERDTHTDNGVSQDILWIGYKGYAEHTGDCLTCKEYERVRWGRVPTVKVKEEK